jgi:hypothetical protein
MSEAVIAETCHLRAHVSPLKRLKALVTHGKLRSAGSMILCLYSSHGKGPVSVEVVLLRQTVIPSWAVCRVFYVHAVNEPSK